VIIIKNIPLTFIFIFSYHSSGKSCFYQALVGVRDICEQLLYLRSGTTTHGNQLSR